MSLTNFPNGITSFGVPVLGSSGIPATTGQYFFVSSTTGSNGNDGLSSDAPLATLAQANTLARAGYGDTIVLMPGHTETISTVVALKSGVRVVGLGGVTLTGSSADIISITSGAGNVITGVNFVIASTCSAILLVGCTDVQIVGNNFSSAVGGAASYFIEMATTASQRVTITQNRFISNLVVAGGAITQTAHILGLGIGHVIELNSFVAGRVTTANAGAVTTGILFAAAADAGNLVRWNSFTEFNGATFTAGVDYGTTAVGGSVMCYENNFMLATAANAVVNGSNAANFANNIASGTV